MSPCFLSLFFSISFFNQKKLQYFFRHFSRDKFASLILQSFFFFFDISNAGFTRRRHTHEHYRELVSLHLLAYFTLYSSIYLIHDGFPVYHCVVVVVNLTIACGRLPSSYSTFPLSRCHRITRGYERAKHISWRPQPAAEENFSLSPESSSAASTCVVW